MSKVTSKLQVTIPKAVADTHRIKPGTNLVFESVGDVIRIRLVSARVPPNDLAGRLAAFDLATQRQVERNKRLRAESPEVFVGSGGSRDWSREDLYDRGMPR